MEEKSNPMKSVGIIIIILAILAVAYFVFFRRSNKSPDLEQNNMANNSSSISGAPEESVSPSESNESSVTITDFQFSPANITVKKGTKVTWANNDSAPHTVTADQGSGPASDNLNQNDVYSYTFDTAGAFNYHCNIHRSMHGSVTVTE